MRDAQTNWQAVLLSLAVPALLVAGLMYLAVQPQWDESDEWLMGLFALIPFEFARVIVVRILRDAYREFGTPWQAIRFFLLSLAALAGLALVFALLQTGVRTVVAALFEAHTWRIVLPPLALIVADGVINLYFFRGDRREQAARLDAIADDTEDWLVVAVTRLPFIVAFVYAAALFLRSRGVAVPTWIPELTIDAFREIALLLVAFYFAIKALLVAHVYTAHFASTGRRLLGASWFQFIVGKKRGERLSAVKAEERAAQRRRAALAGSEAQNSPSAPSRPDPPLEGEG